MRRREFLVIPARSLGGVLLYTLAREPIRLYAQESPQKGTLRVPLRFFTADEAKIVTAACERIFPADDSGPGATEAGVVIYIDRQLAGPYGRDQYRYTKGPWVQSVAEHGNQDKATPREIYREGIGSLGGFTELPAGEQDGKLHAIEKTAFFQLLRRHTIEGMFSDPLHGGNAEMIGWQLIGYPGPRMSYREEIGQDSGEAWRRKPVSLAESLGHAVSGMEEEQ
ncbi:MAG TPA: gluconate 2-dehydrogenase subunit 3 family protein [Bryobacteraceae bacterium]|nr:gluconate 2-dehydrogenase subunit 3 family protein [Bryobacteraceae bacterium]